MFVCLLSMSNESNSIILEIINHIIVVIFCLIHGKMIKVGDQLVFWETKFNNEDLKINPLSLPCMLQTFSFTNEIFNGRIR